MYTDFANVDLEAIVTKSPEDYIESLKKSSDSEKWEKIVNQAIKEKEEERLNLLNQWARNTLMIGLWEQEREKIWAEKGLTSLGEVDDDKEVEEEESEEYFRDETGGRSPDLR